MNDNKMIKNYNNFSIDLDTMMKKRNMSKKRLCDLTGLKFNGLQRYYKNVLKRVDLDILARICTALDCDIEDVIKRKK